MADCHKMAVDTSIVSMISLTVLLVFVVNSCACVRYEPNWKSIDSRPLPVWYDESKIGIFLHWGVFSVPSYSSPGWFWELWRDNKSEPIVKYVKDNFKKDFTYADFAKDYTAELFDPNDWAEIFKASGAK